MGKEWDDGDNFIPSMTEAFKECLRVMKPGAHGLVWALPRTSHWTATALENAGFEIRDVVTHIFGSGFPKSLDISKAIDKAMGITEWKETTPNPAFRANQLEHDTNWDTRPRPPKPVVETDEAKEWQGWGTALKPASEHWILVRKPLSEKTVAKNVLKHGTGGINIDASRIGMSENDRQEYIEKRKSFANTEVNHGWKNSSETLSVETYINNSSQGRFPANLVLDEVAAEMLDEQSGSASRFFYVAKASKKDRNEGLEGMPERDVCEEHTNKGNHINSKWIIDPRNPNGGYEAAVRKPSANHHPTVKSTKLMEYLITLVTPPNGVVLDPFMGSGSTGKAAKKLGFKFIGIEKEQEYFEIAEKRIGGENVR